MSHYDTDLTDQQWALIAPLLPPQPARGRKRRQGRPAGSFAVGRYQGRWKIERLNAWMDIYRRVAICWDRTQTAFTAWVTLSCILICMNNILR